MSATTLNQIVARIQSLALNHKQVKYFYFGNMIEVLNGADLVYPACFVEMIGATVSTQDDQTHYQFRIWFADVLNISDGARENYLELQSDLMLIAEDMISMMNSTILYDYWTINETYPIQFAEEQLRDYVMTVSFDVEIAITYLADRCIVPEYLTTYRENGI